MRQDFLARESFLLRHHIQTSCYHHDNEQKKRQTNTYTQGPNHTCRLTFIFIHVIQSRSQAI